MLNLLEKKRCTVEFRVILPFSFVLDSTVFFDKQCVEFLAARQSFFLLPVCTTAKSCFPTVATHDYVTKFSPKEYEWE